MRLSPKALELIGLLSEDLGLSRTAVLEMAVRRLAEDEGISTKPAKPVMSPLSESDKAQLAVLDKRARAEVRAAKEAERAELQAAKKAGMYLGKAK